MEKLSNIINRLEVLAPPSFQESYDNSGLITGSPDMDITGALICLDSIESVIDEAINKKCNLVIAHHPIIFSGIKKLNGKNYIERVIIKAIQNNIAIYAIHTNLDNVKNGVNRMICERLKLQNCAILAPKHGILKKLVTFCPVAESEKVRASLFAAGAGNIGNYDECSFNVNGIGTFRGNEFSNPKIGSVGKRELVDEVRIEVVFENFRQSEILSALRKSHPYEEIAYYIHSVDNQYNEVGSGMIGELSVGMKKREFLTFLKSAMQTQCIRYTSGPELIRKVAVCGGSGSFLLQDAGRHGADVLVTADFKYHQFFDGEGRIMIADIGHYESEQFTKELILKFLSQNFTTFALHLSEQNTNPINYF